jgi:hypothetical protein
MQAIAGATHDTSNRTSTPNWRNDFIRVEGEDPKSNTRTYCTFARRRGAPPVTAQIPTCRQLNYSPFLARSPCRTLIAPCLSVRRMTSSRILEWVPARIRVHLWKTALGLNPLPVPHEGTNKGTLVGGGCSQSAVTLPTTPCISLILQRLATLLR